MKIPYVVQGGIGADTAAAALLAGAAARGAARAGLADPRGPVRRSRSAGAARPSMAAKRSPSPIAPTPIASSAAPAARALGRSRAPDRPRARLLPEAVAAMIRHGSRPRATPADAERNPAAAGAGDRLCRAIWPSGTKRSAGVLQGMRRRIAANLRLARAATGFGSRRAAGQGARRRISDFARADDAGQRRGAVLPRRWPTTAPCPFWPWLCFAGRSAAGCSPKPES